MKELPEEVVQVHECSYSCVVTRSALELNDSMHGSMFHIPQQTDCVSSLVTSMNLTNHGV